MNKRLLIFLKGNNPQVLSKENFDYLTDCFKDCLIPEDKEKDSSVAINRLKEYRKASGLTQAELAKKAKVSLSIVKKIEQGYNKASLLILGKLARVLKVDVNNLRAVF